MLAQQLSQPSLLAQLLLGEGNPFRHARGEQGVCECVCVCICAHALWPAWILMQNSTVFCLLLVIVILCTGIREAACMAAAAL